MRLRTQIFRFREHDHLIQPVSGGNVEFFRFPHSRGYRYSAGNLIFGIREPDKAPMPCYVRDVRYGNHILPSSTATSADTRWVGSPGPV